jgi:protein-tyrosine-phosphatase
MNHKPRGLFFSVGDSTRSQIAEGFLRAFAGDEFVAMSAATRSLEAIEGYIIAADKFLKDYVLTPKGRPIAESGKYSVSRPSPRKC